MKLSEKLAKSGVDGKGSASAQNIINEVSKGLNYRKDKSGETLIDKWVIQGTETCKSDNDYHRIAFELGLSAQQVNGKIRTMVKNKTLTRAKQESSKGGYQFKGGKMPIFLTEEHSDLIAELRADKIHPIEFE